MAGPLYLAVFQHPAVFQHRAVFPRLGELWVEKSWAAMHWDESPVAQRDG
jgi:hypothetical protein